MGRQYSPWISEDDLCEWIDEKCDDGTFRSQGHAFEEALKLLREEIDDDGSFSY